MTALVRVQGLPFIDNGIVIMPKVLYIGDSETVISRYCVGADVFEQAYFNDNGRYLREAMYGRPEIELRHIIPAGCQTSSPRPTTSWRSMTS